MTCGEGPFEIARKISPVTYELNRRTRKRIVYLNMLKKWNPPDASVLGLVVVAEKEEDEGQDPKK